MVTENSSAKNNIAAGVAVLLFIGSIIFLSIEMGRNNQLEGDLKNERLSSESMLSEKLSLDKAIAKIKSELKSLEGKNSDLDEALTASFKKLETADDDLRRSKSQISSQAHLRKQIKELQKLKEDSELQLANYKISLQQLQSLNDDLEIAVGSLQQQNKGLLDELNAIRLVSMNEVLVESTKKNGRLTVKAKRTKNLIVNVDIPANAENLSFKITSPSGKELTNKEGTIAINIVRENKPRSKAFYVANSSLAPPAYNQVQISYVANDKLLPGIYKTEILSNSVSIGSLQVKLR